jgi:hypothetical protein
MKKIGISVVMVLLHFCLVAYGFEKPTHMAINIDIATRGFNNFLLDSYLRDQLGLSKGVKEEFNGKQTIIWVGEGGIKEDEPEGIPRQIVGKARNQNHFHNPLKPWDQAGLHVVPYAWRSSVVWGQYRNQLVF